MCVRIGRYVYHAYTSYNIESGEERERCAIFLLVFNFSNINVVPPPPLSKDFHPIITIDNVRDCSTMTFLELSYDISFAPRFRFKIYCLSHDMCFIFIYK